MVKGNKYCQEKKRFVNIKKQPPEVFCEKVVLRNFTKFTGKHLCQSLFFNKVAGLTPLVAAFEYLVYICFHTSVKLYEWTLLYVFILL